MHGTASVNSGWRTSALMALSFEGAVWRELRLGNRFLQVSPMGCRESSDGATCVSRRRLSRSAVPALRDLYSGLCARRRPQLVAVSGSADWEDRDRLLVSLRMARLDEWLVRGWAER